MSDVIAIHRDGVSDLVRRDTASFAQVYHDLVSIAGTFILFSAFTGYLFSTGALPLPPLAWVIALGGLTLPLFFSLGTWRALTTSPVPVWGALYLLISGLSYLWSSQGGAVFQEMRTRVLAVLVLLLVTSTLSSGRAVIVARRTLVACVFVGIATNVYEVFHPLTFSGIIGRSAGFYINPNSSASAMVIALVLSIDIVPQRYRALYLVAGCGGMFLTVSRGAILVSVLAFTYLWYRDTIQAKRIASALGVAALVLAVVFVSSGQVRRLAEFAQIAARNGVLQRFTDPEAAMQGGDNSTNLRADAALRAWDQFKLHPVLGKGIGSTLGAFGLPSTHNIYLRQLAEFGFLGVLLYPLVLFAAVRGAGPRARPTAMAFLIAMVVFGLFSHNMLDEWHCLYAIALMAAIVKWDDSAGALRLWGDGAMRR